MVFIALTSADRLLALISYEHNVQLEVTKAADISSMRKQEVRIKRFNRMVQFELIDWNTLKTQQADHKC